MRVTQLIDSMGPGGGQRQIVLLAEGLRDRGWQVQLAWYNPTAHFFEPPPGVTALQLPRNGRRDPRFAWQLAKLVSRKNTDLVHAWLGAPSLYAALAGRLPGAAPVVAGVLCSPSAFGPLPSEGHAYRVAAHLATHVTANSQPGLQWLQHLRVPEPRRTFIGNVVDPRLVHRVPSTVAQRTALLGSLGLDPARPPIVCLGRFDPFKNQDGLLRAVLQLRDAGVVVPPVLMAGFLEDQDRVAKVRAMAAAAQFTDLHIVPAVKDVPTLLEAARFSVLASHSEGLPNVVLEAMALGTVMVATAVGEVPWLVQDSVTGLVCPPGDDAALAGALRRALDLPAERAVAMGIAARAQILDVCSEQRVVGALDGLYRRVLGIR